MNSTSLTAGRADRLAPPATTAPVLDLSRPIARGAHPDSGAARLRRRFAPRDVPAQWAASRQNSADIVTRLGLPPFGSGNTDVARERRRAVRVLLDWLEQYPGDSWQERWLTSGAQACPGPTWRDLPTAWMRQRACALQPPRLDTGLLALICADVIRPGTEWMLTRRSPRFTNAMMSSRDPEGFARLRRTADATPGARPLMVRLALTRTATILACKGGLIANISVGDCVQLLDLQSQIHSKGGTCKTYFYQLLLDAGVLGPEAPPTVRAFRGATGQRSVEALVDRHHLRNQPVRNLIVDYLGEQQPRLDYTSLEGVAFTLAGLFWADLERHHPDLPDLRLSPQIATEWKQRLSVKSQQILAPDGNRVEVIAPRVNAKSCLLTVRAFYLDIAHNALEDPARWGPWAAPCPISTADVNRIKDRRHRKARMDQRTRDQLPALPALVRDTHRHRIDAAALLHAAEQATPLSAFTAAGQNLTRVLMPHSDTNKVWASDPSSGNRRDLTSEEDQAFWAWAVIEVLRHTGIRAEELLELTHHSLVQYRLPDTREVVPLLQIAPSKSDAERLLLVSPELADVLSTVIRRVRGSDGRIPSVPSYDIHERIWLAPMPLLFQRRLGAENRAISRRHLDRLLAAAVHHASLTNPGDAAITFTAHDFRRIFVTDAIMNGLPPHIAQIICGHRDLKTTMGYKAIYPEEAINAHRAFIDRRRATRPGAEYRPVTDEEWDQFLTHFQQRKVSLGTCARAYATPCIHEHACLRCALLRPDPAQRQRLVEIKDNLHQRIDEAHREGWLGEIDGLQTSLTAAEDKLQQMDDTLNRRTDLPLPRTRPHHQP